MFTSNAEKTLFYLVLIGAPITTLFLLTNTVTDPVNAPKLMVAGGLGVGMFTLFLKFFLKKQAKNFKVFILLIGIFNLALINSIVLSGAPLDQQIFGVYGRNTGYIAYLIFSLATIGTLGLVSRKSFSSLLNALQISGMINVFYCLWVLLFGDFLKWNNPYGNILGLFGNPDFISAFLGIYITSLVVIIFSKDRGLAPRIGAFVLAFVAFFEVVKSHAIQGIAVTFAGVAIVIFYVLRDRFKSPAIPLVYLLICILVGVTAVLGALQTGPLDFIYKRSVSLRGIYWQTAVNMGMKHPISGVGLDSYGDWYRYARPLKAFKDPGVNTTSNAAHNVLLDFFASGGFPLFISYLAILVIGLVSITQVTLRQKKFDPIFVTLAATWLTYQLQSIISINQVGLAIWGWLLTGALVSFEFSSRPILENTKPRVISERVQKNLKKSEVISPQLVACIGAALGIFIASPPLTADTKWRSALDSRDANKVMEALEPTLLNPSDSQRYAQAVQLLANSNLLSQAHKIALDAVRFNPNNYQSWRNLYFLQNSTQSERSQALENLNRLDPNNPDVKAP
jgi:O-antigen ligase